MITVIFHKDQRLHLGVKTEKGILDVEAALAVYPEVDVPVSVVEVIAKGEEGKQSLSRLVDKAYQEDTLFYPDGEVTFGPCVPEPQKNHLCGIKL